MDVVDLATSHAHFADDVTREEPTHLYLTRQIAQERLLKALEQWDLQQNKTILKGKCTCTYTGPYADFLLGRGQALL